MLIKGQGLYNIGFFNSFKNDTKKRFQEKDILQRTEMSMNIPPLLSFFGPPVDLLSDKFFKMLMANGPTYNVNGLLEKTEMQRLQQTATDFSVF